MKPRVKIFLRQKKVTTQMIAKSLASIGYDIYKPTFTVSFQLHETDLFVSGLDFQVGTEKQKSFLFQLKNVCYSTSPILLRRYFWNQPMYQFYQRSPGN